MFTYPLAWALELEPQVRVAHLPLLAALGPQAGQLAVRQRVHHWAVHRQQQLCAVATVDAAPQVLPAAVLVADADVVAPAADDDAVAAAAVVVVAAAAVGVAIL